MKKTFALVLALVMVFALAACGGAAAPASTAPASTAPASTAPDTSATEAGVSDLRVATLLTGPINDGGWNTMAYNALKAAESDLGAEIAYTENVALNDQVQLLRQYVAQDYNVIIGHGYEFGDALLQVGEEFPEVYFLNYGGAISNGSNVGSIGYAYGETGALMGVLIGMHEDITKVGVVHAFENPTGHQESFNVEEFAKKYNPDIEFVYSYTGDWDDVAKAKEAAQAHFDNGCQAIVSDMSGPAAGMIQAVEENDGYYVELTFDALSMSPEHVISSAIHDATMATLAALELVRNGEFSGETYYFGLEDGVMSVGDYGPSVTDEMKAEVEKVKAEIIAGEAELIILL